ncbi:class IIb bacteriocin, lactobin A/cerein 7B family [Streptococcus sp. sy010]|uniref:class IIb bacteriocin, lactobin A/cerein 7B family n=1 Tax=Streptococcus sp. sy010 TaxID=2600148 RepID=UPI0011B55E21|nr:class IIb bacteriocin, lactobin A/cerein 7B family [Streptococcus sp. sy010]TWT16297.1 class IIb bacteriocin, lactobin A/cerein 7B family [Streptococcus sp. sy010]
MYNFDHLTEEELLNIEGGIEPITVGIGLGSLFISAVKIGYDFGRDLARRGR